MLHNKKNINAPRVVIRPHVPWYRRLLIAAIGILLVALLAYGMYMVGQGAAQPASNVVADPVLEQILESNSCLEKYDSALCSQLAELVRQLQISNATRADLVKQVKSLDEENERLREDLSLFQQMVSGNEDLPGAELVIHRFTLEQGQLPGEYLYTLLLAQGSQRSKEFNGKLEFVVGLLQNGEEKFISLVDENASKEFPINFRFYHRLEKSFQIPADTVVKNLQVFIYENGLNEAVLTKTIQLSQKESGNVRKKT
ncbi:DUF6776 family protein [Nitrosomonas eutropha]|uniref:Transmembrane protein n=2 Tax=Nitrosomonas eutropha TaxID=916 RepID=A0ABX5MD96_9PROT|nr:DUF6776 family protein [Nitrosomonas eutropha]ABI59035.1 conserved hypothetical protein [Nitrosomonas eutropha C91]PXV84006.1 hypothetical protein C8R14_102125 [Nitrosomonas eutropha]SEI46713.1 hypothetical protein SAMN05216318_103122 [Nitrosomonas eutropha]